MSNFKSFSRSLDQFFLTVGQNNFVPFFSKVFLFLFLTTLFVMNLSIFYRLPRILVRNFTAVQSIIKVLLLSRTYLLRSLELYIHKSHMSKHHKPSLWFIKLQCFYSKEVTYVSSSVPQPCFCNLPKFRECLFSIHIGNEKHQQIKLFKNIKRFQNVDVHWQFSIFWTLSQVKSEDGYPTDLRPL